MIVGTDKGDCIHTNKPFYERKKQLFREWYWRNKASEEFREKMREKGREAYLKSRNNLKELKKLNVELERQNEEYRLIIDDLKKLLDFELEE